MSKNYFNQIRNELQRWLLASQKLRRSGSVCYAKIKSNIAGLEPVATKEEIEEFKNEAGL
jgi:hypothetical protein